MFKIYNGRTIFYQWDSNQKLIVEDPSILEVHFCNGTGDCSLVCRVYDEDGARVVDVPNTLLQDYFRIKVYGYLDNYTKVEKCFEVVKRSKPDDYIYTETEIKRYEALEERVEALEKNGGAGGDCLINEIAELKPISRNIYKPVPVEEWVDNTIAPGKGNENENYCYTLIPVEAGKTYSTKYLLENPMIYVNKDDIEGVFLDYDTVDFAYSSDYSTMYDIAIFTIPEGYNYMLISMYKQMWGSYGAEFEECVEDFNNKFEMVEGYFPINETEGMIIFDGFTPYEEGYVIKPEAIQKEELIEETAEAAAALIDDGLLKAIGTGVLK